MKLLDNQQAGLIIWGTKRGKKVFLNVNIGGDATSLNNDLFDVRTSIQFSKTAQQFYSLEKRADFSRYTLYTTILDWAGRLGYMAISVIIPNHKALPANALFDLLKNLNTLYHQEYVNGGSKPVINEQVEDVRLFQQLLKSTPYQLSTVRHENESLHLQTLNRAFAYYQQEADLFKVFDSHQQLGYIELDLLYLLPKNNYDLSCNYTQLNLKQLIVLERQFKLVLRFKDKENQLVRNVPIQLYFNNQQVYQGQIPLGEKRFDAPTLKKYDTVNIEILDTNYYTAQKSIQFSVQDFQQSIDTNNQLHYSIEIEDLKKLAQSNRQAHFTIKDAKTGGIAPNMAFHLHIDQKVIKKSTDEQGKITLDFAEFILAKYITVQAESAVEGITFPTQQLLGSADKEVRISIPSVKKISIEQDEKTLTPPISPKGQHKIPETFQPPIAEKESANLPEIEEEAPNGFAGLIKRLGNYLPVIGGLVVLILVILYFVIQKDSRAKKANQTLLLVDSLLNVKERQDSLFQNTLTALNDNKKAIEALSKKDIRLIRYINKPVVEANSNFEYLKSLILTKHRNFYFAELKSLNAAINQHIAIITKSGDTLSSYESKLSALNISSLQSFTSARDTAFNNEYIRQYNSSSVLLDNLREANELFYKISTAKALAAKRNKTSAESDELIRLVKGIITSPTFCYIVDKGTNIGYNNLGAARSILLDEYLELGATVPVTDIAKNIRTAMNARRTTSKYYSDTDPCI